MSQDLPSTCYRCNYLDRLLLLKLRPASADNSTHSLHLYGSSRPRYVHMYNMYTCGHVDHMHAIGMVA
jgi:hypothetical protein